MRLDDLRWRSSTSPDASVEGNDKNPVEETKNKVLLAPSKLELYQVARMRARITPFAGDYRAALALVRQFADNLRSLPGVESVEVESLPLDIGPQASLSGDARKSGPGAVAEFELRVAIRDGGERA